MGLEASGHSTRGTMANELLYLIAEVMSIFQGWATSVVLSLDLEKNFVRVEFSGGGGDFGYDGLSQSSRLLMVSEGYPRDFSVRGLLWSSRFPATSASTVVYWFVR
ncbi:hypothetical protein BHE74_00052354 [Ensete ventricosum]|nr:hypothetical protein BHE74_00052354 [Ensete ventricosum]